MTKEIITNRQGFTLLVIFTMCNAYSLLFGADCGRDIWIAYLLAAALAVLLWALLTRSFERRPYGSLFEMLSAAFGNVGGRVVTALLCVYAALSCTTSLALFGRFTQLTALSKTPQLLLPLLLLLLAAWGLKSGLEVVARGASMLFYFVIITFLYFVIFGVPLLDVRNITPVLADGILRPARSALSIFTNQFGDTLLLFAVYPSIRRAPNRRRTMICAMLCAGIFAAVIALITVLTIGGNQTGAEFFPVFTILSIRNIGGYIRHMEILTSIAMTFFVFIRATLCLYFIANACSHLFSARGYQRILTPIALLIASGTQLLYWDMMSLRARIESNWNLYILIPLQLILPVVTVLLLRRYPPRRE